MKWYKHLSGSLNDSFIFELVNKFGGDGYMVFFGTLEAMSDEFDIYNPGKNTFLIKKLTKNFQLSRQKTVKIWKFCDEHAKKNYQKHVSFFANVNGDYVELNCPRLKELTDEYTQRELKKLSGVNRDNNPSMSGVCPEQEAEEDISTNVDTGRKRIPKTETSLFQEWWYEKYKYKTGEDYIVKNFGQFGRDVKSLLKICPLVDLEYRAIEFFLDTTDFVTGNEEKGIDAAGYGFEVFRSRINKYTKYKNTEFREKNKKHIRQLK